AFLFFDKLTMTTGNCSRVRSARSGGVGISWFDCFGAHPTAPTPTDSGSAAPAVLTRCLLRLWSDQIRPAGDLTSSPRPVLKIGPETHRRLSACLLQRGEGAPCLTR